MKQRGWALFAFCLMMSHNARAQNAAATFDVDAAQGRHAINPNIYGVSFGDAATLGALNCPLNRWGGNSTSRYNWKQNASNRASDYFFESIADEGTAEGASADAFIQATRGAGAQPVITVPTIGWVARVGANRDKLASFSVAKYGAQQQTDQWMPDAGNGLHIDGSKVTGNDPNDANVPSNVAFQQGWLAHLKTKWGSAPAGVRYYALDNEPSLWHETHRDVHPNGATMEEVRDAIINYGSMIKTADPNAVTLGPEEWGWPGYLLSGADQKWSNEHHVWSNQPDKTAHGGMDFLPWLLDQLKQKNDATGKRALDVLTVHYYPQGGEFSDDTSEQMQLRRNRSTRSLWDANYVDETWIADKVRLIPRLKSWVAQGYPNTKIGVTEYSWGADNHINGATAEADVLGIFGREGLDMANRWTAPAQNSFAFKAMQMYRNYDGEKHTFGETGVQISSTTNPDSVSAFAALRADGALTVMVVSKVLAGATPLTLSPANFNAASAQVWQLSSSGIIVHLANVAVAANKLQTNLPAQSVTLFVIAPHNVTDTTPPTVAIARPVNNSALTALTAMRGGATDNVGVSRVTLLLERESDAKFWTGAAWGAVTALATIMASATTWTKTTGFPATGTNAATQLTEGRYLVAAYAYDAAGNRTSSGATSRFLIDRTAPLVAISVPANDTTIGDLSSVNGTASDPRGASDASGVARVLFNLRRSSDNLYWNGSAWSSSTTRLATTLSATTSGVTWKKSGLLPTRANGQLADGVYTISARSYDRAGNPSAHYAQSVFTIKANPALAAQLSSNIVLSSATLRGSQLVLTFSGNLDAASLAPNCFAVRAGETSVGIENVSLNANATSIALRLSQLFARGAALVVSWNVLDANKRLASGETIVAAS